jgi:hypothetical protein
MSQQLIQEISGNTIKDLYCNEDRKSCRRREDTAVGAK